jgi:hypothetical protein
MLLYMIYINSILNQSSIDIHFAQNCMFYQFVVADIDNRCLNCALPLSFSMMVLHLLGHVLLFVVIELAN